MDEKERARLLQEMKVLSGVKDPFPDDPGGGPSTPYLIWSPIWGPASNESLRLHGGQVPTFTSWEEEVRWHMDSLFCSKNMNPAASVRFFRALISEGTVEEVWGDVIRLVYEIVDEGRRSRMSKEMLELLPGHGLKRQ
jgi:hypothetical protein